MKISNLSIVGYIAGAIYAGVTIYHYWIKYPDTSQFLMNMALAVLMIFSGWIYNKQLQQSYSIDAMGEFLAEKQLKDKPLEATDVESLQ